MKYLISLLLLCFCVSAFAGRDWWKDDPRFQYDPNYPRDEVNLKEINYMDEKEFTILLDNKKAKNYIPLDISDKDVLAFAAATSLGLVVMKNDRKIMDVVQSVKTDVPQGLMDFGYQMGYKTGLGPLIIGSYFLGVVFDNKELKAAGLITLAAEAATGIVTEAFKTTFQRQRPSTSESPYMFFMGEEHKSFFSGHSAAAFSAATIFSLVFGKKYPAVPYIAYGVAAITAYSRMHARGHWGSDVIFGAIAGHLISKIVYKIIMDKDDGKEKFWSLKADIDVRNKGLRVSIDYIPRPWR